MRPFLTLRFLQNFHYFLLTGHPGEGQMNASMGRELYWPYMSDDVYATVRDWRSCAQNCTHGNRQRQLGVFPQRTIRIRRHGHVRPCTKDKRKQPICSCAGRHLYKADQRNTDYKNERYYSSSYLPCTLGRKLRYSDNSSRRKRPLVLLRVKLLCGSE